MITRREPRSRQQRPYSSQTMRTFSIPLSGTTARPFESGAADAAVASNALAPNASETMIFFILNSSWVVASEVTRGSRQMFLDRRPSVSSQPRNGLHARWLFWGCKTHTSKEQAVIIEHCRLVSSWEQPLSRNRRAVRQVRRPLPRPRRTLRPTLPMPRQPNAHRRLTLPCGASRQIPRRTNPPRLHLVAPRRRKLLVPPPVRRRRKPRLPHNRPRLLRPKPTSHLRRTARPSRPPVPGPEIPTRLRSNLINQTSRALRSRRRPTSTRRCTSTISKERE